MNTQLILVAAVLTAAPSAYAATCEGLTALKIPDATVTSAVSVPPSMAVELPKGGPPGVRRPVVAVPFCRVTATLRPTSDSDIRVEVWLPAPENWNGKLEGMGNGGLGGVIPVSEMVPGLARGYAVAATDIGHESTPFDGRFALGHPEKIADYAYRATHLTAVFGKEITDNYYGRAPEHAYFSGCSDGGREALMEAQRFPTDYDGIVAGNPSIKQTYHEVGAHLWIPLALSAANGLSLEKVALIGRAVNNACDALDGVKDGVLEDPRMCHFDPSELLCKGPDAPDCLTAAQVEAVRKIWDGPKSVLGPGYYPGLERGGEADTWKGFIVGPTSAAPEASIHVLLGLPFFRYFVFADPNWSYRKFDFKTDPTLIDQKFAALVNATNPDLGPFERNGGKLIHYHGYSDPDIPPRSSIDYYESVSKKLGGQLDSFYRLFMVPGMGHCGGGPGANTFDMLSALEQWVEHGVPPTRIIATKYVDNDPKKAVVRTHPLCRYPDIARYNGRGAVNDAANFVCAAESP